MRLRPRRRVSRSASATRSRGKPSSSRGPATIRLARWSHRARREKISVPRYGDGRGDDCLEGEVATPATMIEHAAAVAPSPNRLLHRRWKLCRLCLNRSPPPSVTSASGLTPGSGTASSTIRSPPVCSVVSRSSRGRIGRKFRTARRERAFIGPVTPNGVLSGKRRRDRRWGSRAEPFALLRKVATCARRRRCRVAR